MNGLPMADTLQPRNAKEVEAAVQWLLAEGKAEYRCEKGHVYWIAVD